MPNGRNVSGIFRRFFLFISDVARYTRIHYGNYYDRALQRARKFSLVLERLISPEGTFPVFGRSIPCRMAAMQPLAMMAWYGTLPDGLAHGQVRAALTAVMHNMFDGKENFNEGGFLTIWFAGRQPNVADGHNVISMAVDVDGVRLLGIFRDADRGSRVSVACRRYGSDGWRVTDLTSVGRVIL